MPDGPAVDVCGVCDHSTNTLFSTYQMSHCGNDMGMPVGSKRRCLVVSYTDDNVLFYHSVERNDGIAWLSTRTRINKRNANGQIADFGFWMFSTILSDVESKTG